MPKKRKTREHKISIDQKRQEVHKTELSGTSSPQSSQLNQHTQEVSEATFSLPENYRQTQSVQKARTKTTQTIAISTDEYGYLGKDLMKSVLLSGAIVIAELLIRLFYSH